MAEKMTQAQMKEKAKAQVLAMVTMPENAEVVGGCEFAIPTEVNGQEIWVEIKATCKNWYDTKTTKAYDPFVKQSDYNDTIAERERKEAERIAKKEAKIAKSKAKSE